MPPPEKKSTATDATESDIRHVARTGLPPAINVDDAIDPGTAAQDATTQANASRAQSPASRPAPRRTGLLKRTLAQLRGHGEAGRIGREPPVDDE